MARKFLSKSQNFAEGWLKFEQASLFSFLVAVDHRYPLTKPAMESPSEPSYLIIGAGVFGASTAYHLIARHPHACVNLVDRTPFPCKSGASWDWNKVARSDYENLFYMQLGLEALHQWKTNPLFKPYYHESGVVWMGSQRKGLGKDVIENYKTLQAEVDCEIMDVAKLKTL